MAYTIENTARSEHSKSLRDAYSGRIPSSVKLADCTIMLAPGQTYAATDLFLHAWLGQLQHMSSIGQVVVTRDEDGHVMMPDGEFVEVLAVAAAAPTPPPTPPPAPKLEIVPELEEEEVIEDAPVLGEPEEGPSEEEEAVAEGLTEEELDAKYDKSDLKKMLGDASVQYGRTWNKSKLIAAVIENNLDA